MSHEVKLKDHYFELSLRSVSRDENGDYTLNQEIPIVREFAATPGELVVKQMLFSEDVAVPVADVVLKAMGKMAQPFRDLGTAEMAAMFADFAEGKPNKPAKK